MSILYISNAETTAFISSDRQAIYLNANFGTTPPIKGIDVIGFLG
jgi:hypothetical protein